jgi:hypothetical protein
MADSFINYYLLYKLLDKWIKSKNDLKLNENNEAINFTFLTCGDWDLIKMLPGQCQHFKIDYPNYLRQWCNLKKAYCESTGHFPRGMITMLEQMSELTQTSVFFFKIKNP